MTNPSYVNLDNSKRDKESGYNNVIEQIQKDGVCPFCPEQLEKYHKNPILRETTSWLATKNMYPYKGAALHILFIHKKHIVDISDIRPEAWSEFHTLVSDIEKDFDIKGGTCFIRFGDTKYTGASVSHLHAHIIMSDPFANTYTPIMARVG